MTNREMQLLAATRALHSILADELTILGSGLEELARECCGIEHDAEMIDRMLEASVRCCEHLTVVADYINCHIKVKPNAK